MATYGRDTLYRRMARIKVSLPPHPVRTYDDAMARRRRNSLAPSNGREGRRGRRLGLAWLLQEGRDIGIVLNFKNRVPGA